MFKFTDGWDLFTRGCILWVVQLSIIVVIAVAAVLICLKFLHII